MKQLVGYFTLCVRLLNSKKKKKPIKFHRSIICLWSSILERDIACWWALRPQLAEPTLVPMPGKPTFHPWDREDRVSASLDARFVSNSTNQGVIPVSLSRVTEKRIWCTWHFPYPHLCHQTHGGPKGTAPPPQPASPQSPSLLLQRTPQLPRHLKTRAEQRVWWWVVTH